MTTINVGMSEIHISGSKSTLLVAPGLGSCIGLIMYDPVAKIGGMAHVVLPDSTTSTKELIHPGKFADTAVPELLSMLTKKGASKHNLIIKISGGAQMFSLERGGNVLNIGMRNAIAVKAALAKERLNLKSADTGGNKGRTMRLEIETGIVYVRCIGQQEVTL